MHTTPQNDGLLIIAALQELILKLSRLHVQHVPHHLSNDPAGLSSLSTLSTSGEGDIREWYLMSFN